MNPLAKTGAIIVVCALASYSVAVFVEQRRRLVTPLVLLFFTLGVMLDVTATGFMIAGSSKGPFTLHGLLGYSSLAGMIIDAALIWRFRLNNPQAAQVRRRAPSVHARGLRLVDCGLRHRRPAGRHAVAEPPNMRPGPKVTQVSILNDVLGPVMRGPSSSHTAGSFHIAKIVTGLLGAAARRRRVRVRSPRLLRAGLPAAGRRPRVRGRPAGLGPHRRSFLPIARHRGRARPRHPLRRPPARPPGSPQHGGDPDAGAGRPHAQRVRALDWRRRGRGGGRRGLAGPPDRLHLRTADRSAVRAAPARRRRCSRATARHPATSARRSATAARCCTRGGSRRFDAGACRRAHRARPRHHRPRSAAHRVREARRAAVPERRRDARARRSARVVARPGGAGVRGATARPPRGAR